MCVSLGVITTIGLGLGAILSRSSKVTDKMVETASLALADSLTEEERSLDLIYPRIERIRDISAHIALSVVRQSQKEVSTIPTLPSPSFVSILTKRD